MAWIKLHEELPRHPKTRMFARALGISQAQAIGHLVAHFVWALSYAQDGVIRYDSVEVADGAIWDGDPDQFIKALSDTRWHDHTENGIEIHDWYEYAGRMFEGREANAERMREKRAKAKAERENARATNVQNTCDERTGARVEESRVDKRTTPLPPDGGLQPVSPKKKPKKGELTADDLYRFDEWYAEYRKKVGKADAQEVWSKLRRSAEFNDELVDRIIAATKAQMLLPDNAKENYRYCKHPATWLNGRRWEDEVTPAQQAKPAHPYDNLFSITKPVRTA